MSIQNVITGTEWDVVVVGTGIGGGTIGYELAKAGKRILFLEKGRNYLNKDNDILIGDYAEHYFRERSGQTEQNRQILYNAGRYFEDIHESSAPRPYDFSSFIGSGSGGSSALYGMVMERFFPEDFAVRAFFQNAQAASIPPNWPIGYEDLRDHYQSAEKLYRVRGTLDPIRKDTLDPLMEAPGLSAPSNELYNFFLKKGLNPYVMPMACEYVPGCQECLGYICPKSCKNDSARICLKPALDRYSAQLLDECEVIRLEATKSQVTGLVCKHRGMAFDLKSKLVILAAGALHTPAILLRSKSEHWPTGLANESGLVGKNLMRHYFDLYCVDTKAEILPDILVKQIALNDLYHTEGHKLGTIQAVGRLPCPAALADDLWSDLSRKGVPLLPHIVRMLKPLIERYARKNIASRLVLTAIMEDLPYESNRIDLSRDGNKIDLFYKISPFEKKRIQLFRKKVKQLISPYKFTFIKNAENNERLAHACGTCRFGDDPAKSVIDANNLAHGLKNLYIVDTSFFPTSAGINPALTVAANAIRVADHILNK